MAFCVIASLIVYAWRAHPAGPHLFLESGRRATITYLFLWLAVAALAILAASGRRSVFASLFLLLLLASEGAAHAYYYHTTGQLYHPPSWVLLNRFQPHPLLVGIPQPGTFENLSHDNRNRRTTVNEAKVADPKRIYVFGGSTTYDISNADSQTWASDLSRLLGPDYEVQNYGAPGYSSLESLIQSLFVFRDVKPVCAVYYLGWNDLRDSHIGGLRNDYSDYHLPRQVGMLAVGHRPGFLENNVLFLQLILRVLREDRFDEAAASRGEDSNEMDPRLTAIFSENVELISAIAQQFGVKPIFVSQPMNYAVFEQAAKGAQAPHITGAAMRPLMGKLNLVLERTAAESGAVYLGAAESAGWAAADFLDGMHFSPAGSEKLAATIAPEIGRICR